MKALKQLLNLVFRNYTKFGELAGKFSTATAGFVSIIILVLTLVNFATLKDRIYDKFVNSIYRDEHLIENLKAGTNWKLFEQQIGKLPILIDEYTTQDKTIKYIEYIYTSKNFFIQMVKKDESQNVLFYTVSQINNNFKPKNLPNKISFEKNITEIVNNFYGNQLESEPENIPNSLKLEKEFQLPSNSQQHYYWQDNSPKFGQKYIEIITPHPVNFYKTYIIGSHNIVTGTLEKPYELNEREISEFRKKAKIDIFGFADYQQDFKFTDFLESSNINIGIQAEKRTKLYNISSID